MQLNPLDGAQEYVPPPLELKVTEFPALIVVDVPATATGIGLIVITCVIVFVPFTFETVSVTVYVPAGEKQTAPGFCCSEEDGTPFGNVHVQLVGPFVLASVNVIQVPSQTVVADA